VRALLGCARRWFATREIRVYALARGLRSIHYAQTHPCDVASANWHATAAVVAQLVPSALLVDIGSTSTDITPIRRNRIEVCGDSDGERMAHGELVYTGVVRTPLMAVVSQLPFAGRWQGVAAEWFATTGDVYLLTGQLPRRHYQTATADRRGLTPAECMRRLARMLGRDAVEGTPAQWIALAHHIAEVHLHSLRSAIERVLSRFPDNSAMRIIGAGCGRFAVREIARQMHYPYVDIGELLRASPTMRDIAAACAPAVAVARLAER
jgi:probable H4MPT-linked C1 transfer pathway protein